MRLSPTLPPAAPPSVMAQPAMVLPVGKILQVEVLQKLADFRYTLRSPLGELTADSQTPLRPGDHLTLRVATTTRAGEPARLDILAPPHAQTAAFLKASLPHQQDPLRLMALLQLLSGKPGAPPALERLMQALPDPARLTQTNGLRDSLLHSGLFLETALLHGSGHPGNDIKSLMLQLWRDLGGPRGGRSGSAPGTPHLAGEVSALPRRELPPALLAYAELASEGLLALLGEDIEGVLARLETHQLLHVQGKDAHTAQWLFELPVRDRDGIDVWQLHVSREERHASGEAAAERLWQITLSFDFPGHGAVLARLSQAGDALTIRFHADQASTHAWLSARTGQLGALLREKGVSDVQVLTQRGMPHRDTLPPAMHSLLAERA